MKNVSPLVRWYYTPRSSNCGRKDILGESSRKHEGAWQDSAKPTEIISPVQNDREALWRKGQEKDADQ